MNTVYSCAFLNISATRSSEGGESLFYDRAMSPNLPSKITLDIDGTLQDYFIIDNAPLNNRGWVFQERFSARRVLHFGRQELAWECRELEASEMFPNGLPRASTASYISKSRMYETFLDPSHMLGGALDRRFANHWHTLVENFSKCGLTRPTVKLIAFNGVAKDIMATRGGRCVVGIWQNHIAYDLTWYRSSDAQESFSVRETSFRAPSWSWASVDGGVHYPGFLGEVRRHFIDQGEIMEPNGNGNNVHFQNHLIQIQGTCIPLKINWADGEMSSFESSGFRFPLHDTFGAEVALDGPEEEVRELVDKFRLRLVLLLATSQCVYGVMLARSEASTCIDE